MRRCRRDRMLFAVTAKTVHITIDASIEGDELRGQVADGLGRETHFSGWLALITALDRLLSATERVDDQG
jgi:hypothetical protein